MRAELPHACGGHDGAALFDWIWSYFKSLAAPRIPTATGVEICALSVLNCRVHSQYVWAPKRIWAPSAGRREHASLLVCVKSISGTWVGRA